MQVNFFGTDADVAEVWRWLLELPGVRLCEVYSRPGQPIRWFETWDTFERAGGVAIESLAAWSPAFGVAPMVETITFAPQTQREIGARDRTVLRSPALISVRRNNDQNQCLTSASISCWNEKGALERSICPPDILAQIDWKAVASASGAVSRRLRKVAPAKLGACSIMPDAWAKFRDREIRLWAWGSECGYPSKLVVEK